MPWSTISEESSGGVDSRAAFAASTTWETGRQAPQQYHTH